jgi:dihydropteroate synthase
MSYTEYNNKQIKNNKKNNIFLSFKDSKISLSNKTCVMGILNITPDSFSDGGKYFSADKAIERAVQIEKEGADFIDIGAQSTRPGYIKISAEDEIKRLEPILQKVKNTCSIPISIDTFYPKVAKYALDCGASIINDVTGFSDCRMFELAKSYSAGGIITYDGNPKGDINCIKTFFKEKLKTAANYGVNINSLCLDPGIGFSKRYSDDINILTQIENYRLKNNAILIGLSNKRIVSTSIDSTDAKDRLIGTAAANAIAILNGANIIRVHNVSAAVVTCKIADSLMKGA